MPTVFLKIRPSKLLKGRLEDYFLVEVPAFQGRVSELRDQLYTGDLLFLLQPATNMFLQPRISVSPEARAEWDIGKSLYMFTMQSTLFTVSSSGNLASPLDVSKEFEDVYSNIRSLEELEARIFSILGGEAVLDIQTEGGSRQWYENIDQDSAPQGLVQQRYDSGQLRSEINYYNGEMEGPARYWYESGALWAEANFNNGEAEGPARHWFENGQLSMEATFRDGQRVECQAWTQEGNPIDCR